MFIMFPVNPGPFPDMTSSSSKGNHTVNALCPSRYRSHIDQPALITQVERKCALAEQSATRCTGTIVLSDDLAVDALHSRGNGAHEGV